MLTVTIPGRRRAALPALLVAASLAAVAAADAAAQSRTYALDEDPVRRGNRALEAGRLDEAEADFREALAAQYQVAPARYGLARIASRRGRWAEAEGFYREAAAARAERDGAEYPEARAGLGLLLLRLGRDDEASVEFDRALAAKPDLWEGLYGRARLLAARGDVAAARRLLARGAQRRGPAQGEDLYHHGLAL